MRSPWPVKVNGQRACALRFADSTVQALLGALLRLRLVANGFACRDLRHSWALLTGRPLASVSQGEMTYHLRRLRLHGLIERLPGTHRYRMTNFGWRVAFFSTRVYARVLRSGLGQLLPPEVCAQSRLARQFERLEKSIDQWIDAQKVPR